MMSDTAGIKLLSVFHVWTNIRPSLTYAADLYIFCHYGDGAIVVSGIKQASYLLLHFLCVRRRRYNLNLENTALSAGSKRVNYWWQKAIKRVR